MDIVEKFQNHADECRRLARFAHDPATKGVWNRMADRWLALAANETARRQRRLAPRARRVHTGQHSRAA
jgi:hypothetical protein